MKVISVILLVGSIALIGFSVAYNEPRIIMIDRSTNVTNISIGTGNITGSGVATYIPKFYNGTHIISSQITDTGTNIGIGVISPQFKLHVNGTGNYTGNLFEGTGRVCTASNGLCGPAGALTEVTAENVRNGTFGANVTNGTYVFPSLLTVKDNLTVETITSPYVDNKSFIKFYPDGGLEIRLNPTM